MALADLAATTTNTPTIPWRTCSVCHVTNQLDPDTRDLLDELLTGAATNKDLARHLTAEGHGPVAPDAVKRHRRGECTLRKVYRT